MQSPFIPRPLIIKNEEVPQDADYYGLRIVRCQTQDQDRDNYEKTRYQFQHQPADYTALKAMLCRKGASEKYRLVAIVHPNMKLFRELVRYDPANPPAEDYDAQGMKDAHERTQSDFKGQKKANTADFKEYLIQGINSNRELYLPVIAGWQSEKVFDKTIFVAFDEGDSNALYGELYLPKAPIMQADGQTQTAAVFATSASADAVQAGALDSLQLTLEIQLKVNERQAAQSFADRNGRGTKKNRNLVISYDTSSPLSDLRVRAIKGTIFETRMADSRTTGITEKATDNIVDLSTMEQMLLNVMSNGNRKPEHFKHYHVEAFLPYTREFLLLLEELFAKDWVARPTSNQDPFRRQYVHGWAFCLKALALAYHRSRIDVIGPLAAAAASEHEIRDATKSGEEKFKLQIENKQQEPLRTPAVSLDELKSRLQQIDWLRYRRHWIALSGFALKKDGKKKTFKLKSSGEEKVVAQAQNTPATIERVAAKILSDRWTDLTEQVDEPPSR